jgi:hypothetical protein
LKFLPASLPRIDIRERFARSRSAANPPFDHIGFNDGHAEKWPKSRLVSVRKDRVAGAVTRAAIAVVGGAAAIRVGASLEHIFMAVSLGMMSFGLLSLPGLFLRSAYGIRRSNSAAGRPYCGLRTVDLCSK